VLMMRAAWAPRVLGSVTSAVQPHFFLGIPQAGRYQVDIPNVGDVHSMRSDKAIGKASHSRRSVRSGIPSVRMPFTLRPAHET